MAWKLGRTRICEPPLGEEMRQQLKRMEVYRNKVLPIDPRGATFDVISGDALRRVPETNLTPEELHVLGRVAWERVIANPEHDQHMAEVRASLPDNDTLDHLIEEQRRRLADFAESTK